MKKYIIIISIALSGLFISCSDDFLRLFPHTQIAAGQPMTRDVIEQIVSSVYQILYFDNFAASSTGSEQWMPVNMFFDVKSDNVYSGGGGPGDQPFIFNTATFSIDPTFPTDGWWVIFFNGLRRANDALAAIENAVEGVDENWLAERRAEVLTLRAYYTMWLWKAYGNIPFFDRPWTQAPFAARQHTRSEMFPIILADLDAAIATPQFPSTRARGGADRGRVHRAMAKMTRARVVLHYQDESQFPRVLADMRYIMNLPDFALVTEVGRAAFTGRQGSDTGPPGAPTTNHFEWIFLGADPAVTMTGGGEFSTESVFEVAHNTNNGVSWGNPWIGFGNATPRFITSRVDARSVDNRFNTGWGFFPVRPEAYAIFNEPGDYRKEASVRNWGAEIENYNFTVGFQNTGIWLMKYTQRFGLGVGSGGSRSLNFTNNTRIFRIAEAYLNAAEIAYQLHGQGAAQPYLDAIRDRAFLTTTNRIPATFSNIKLERRREFFGEGLRFWELLRWGQCENGRPLAEVLSTNNEFQQRTWREYNRLLPIPHNDIVRAAGSQYPLRQNPGF